MGEERTDDGLYRENRRAAGMAPEWVGHAVASGAVLALCALPGLLMALAAWIESLI